MEAILCPNGISNSVYDIVLEVSSVSRLSKMYIPATLLNNPQSLRYIILKEV
jgi:hypothetical protein